MSNGKSTDPPFQARLSASIFAKLRGDNAGLLVVGLLSLGLCFGGLVFESLAPSIWSKILIGAGLVGFGTVLVSWMRRGSSPTREGVPVEVFATNTGVTARTTVRTNRQALAFVRQVVQNRGTPVPPHGEVAGNPSRPETLKEYTPEEQNRVAERLREDVRRHDERVIRGVDEIEQQLPPPTEEELEPGDLEQE